MTPWIGICVHCGSMIRYLGDWVNGWVHYRGSVWCADDYARARP